MKPFGRPFVALFGLLGTMTLMSGGAAAGWAETRNFADDLSTENIGSSETPLGDLIADAIRNVAGTDASFIAASYFVSDVQVRGGVTRDSLVRTLEYKDDSIVIVNLTGAQIVAAMEHSLYLYPKPNSGFLQFSGLVVTVNADGKEDNKVVSVRINGAPLDKNKTYRVAMPAPLANGALAYFRIWTKDNIDRDGSAKLAKTTLQIAIENYLRDHRSLTKGDERLVKGK